MPRRTMKMKPNRAAAVAYLAGWVSGLIIYFMERQNRYVRVHAMQSILISGAFTVAMGAVRLLLGWFFLGRILIGLLGFVFLLVWLLCLVQAVLYRDFRIPLVGRLAENIVDIF